MTKLVKRYIKEAIEKANKDGQDLYYRHVGQYGFLISKNGTQTKVSLVDWPSKKMYKNEDIIPIDYDPLKEEIMKSGTGKAFCHPSDKFKFGTGATTAMNRIIDSHYELEFNKIMRSLNKLAHARREAKDAIVNRYVKKHPEKMKEIFEVLQKKEQRRMERKMKKSIFGYSK